MSYGVVHYEFAETSLGRLIVACSHTGICFAAFGDTDQELLQEAESRLTGAQLTRKDGLPWMRKFAELMEDPLHQVDIPLDLRGTAFQRDVWSALRDIGPGQTTTYGEIASSVGRPKATRAVARACGANPCALVIPCHRIIGADGSLRGYRWGIDRKRALLKREDRPE